jgi:tight adherence protein B
VVSAALFALACALMCAPSRIARARLSALWPRVAPARRRRLRIGGPAALGVVVGLLAAGPGGALAGLLLVTTIARGRATRAAEAAEATGAAELADALRRITDELRTGSHPAVALAGCTADGPVASALLAPAAAAARLGDDVPAALRRGATGGANAEAGPNAAVPSTTGPEARAARQTGSAGRPGVGAELERVAAAWSLAERHGVPLADLLARVHDDIRWRVRFGAGVRAELAGPRATAGVLTALPALGVGLGQLMGADPIGVLRGGVLGQALLVVGVGLIALGRAWTEQILRRAVPR